MTELITEIVSMAEEAIFLQTGVQITLIPCRKLSITAPVQEMICLIAKTLDLTVDDYYERKRERKYTDLRCVAALMIIKFYPTKSLNEIAAYLGMRDHVSVIQLKKRGNDYLETEEDVFTIKYYTCLNEIEQWIKA